MVWLLVGTVARTYARQIVNSVSTKSVVNNANRASSCSQIIPVLQIHALPTAQPALPRSNVQSAHQASSPPTANAYNAYQTAHNALTPPDAKSVHHRLPLRTVHVPIPVSLTVSNMLVAIRYVRGVNRVMR